MCRRLLKTLILVAILVPAQLWAEELSLRGRAETFEQQAEAHSQHGQHREALAALLSAKADYEQLGDVKKTIEITRRLAALHYSQGDLDKALEQAAKAVTLAESDGNAGPVGSSNYMLGLIYRDLGEYHRAIGYFEKAEQFASRAGDFHIRALALNEIGNIFLLRGEPDRALELKKRALDVARASGDDYVVSSCLHDIGLAHVHKKDYQGALSYFGKALDLQRKYNYRREIAICLFNIGGIQQRLGQSQSAVTTLEEALRYSEELNLNSNTDGILASLSSVYADVGQWDKAYNSLARSYRLREELFSDEKAKNIGESHARFEASQRERENEILKRDNRIKDLELTRKQIQRNLLLVVAILAVAVVAVLMNRYRVKSRAHRQLAAANRAIMAQKAELNEANQRLDLLARTDWLTGLPNRREMTDRIAKELAGNFGLFRPFVLILVDIDGFKAINDEYGHGTGDIVLRKLGQKLRELLRGYDSAGRWGGDEFLLLLPASEIENGTAVAQRIHEDISRSIFECDDQQLSLTTTFGVVLCAEPQRTIEEYLKAADRALYQGKKQGRNQVVSFTSAENGLRAQAG